MIISFVIGRDHNTAVSVPVIQLTAVLVEYAWYNWALNGRNFVKFHIFVFFVNLLQEIRVSLNSDKNNE